MTPTAQRLILHVAGGATLAGWGALAWVSWHPSAGDVWRALGAQAFAWVALWVAWRSFDPRSPFPCGRAVVGWAILFRVCGVAALPVLEDDYFRFLWDGRQLIETGNPYAAPPSAFFSDTALPDEWVAVLDRINYPHVPTIYGPVCQYAFGLSYWIAPGQLWPWKMILLLAEAVAVAGAWKMGGPRAGWFAAWCPLAIFETAFNAHPDMLGLGFLVGGLLALGVSAPSPKYPMGAVFLGLAIATKWFAVVLAPFALARRPPREWVVAASVVALSYLPFWAQGSLGDLPALLTFARDWEFNSGLFALAQWGLGPSLGRVASGTLFGALWLLLFWRWVRNEPRPGAWPRGDWVFGALLACSAVINPWYLVWIAPFVAIHRSPAGITALAAVSLSYLTGMNLGSSSLGSFDHPFWVRPAEFGVVAAALLLGRRKPADGLPPPGLLKKP